jgi:N-acetylmuramoyl-L-alanine amidase
MAPRTPRTATASWSGKVHTVEGLSTRWAPSETYHRPILRNLEEMLAMSRHRIVIQAGHCHRQTGSTGTRTPDGYTEQQFAWAVAHDAAERLGKDGHDAVVILADPPDHSDYAGDVFVAVHADGSSNINTRGASVGYRTDEGRALAHAFKAAYRALGWPSGFRSDNYTAALGGYYGCKRAIEQGNRRACIVECGFLTSPEDASELRTPVGRARAAEAIRRAVDAVLGISPIPIEEDDTMWPAMLRALWHEKHGPTLTAEQERGLQRAIKTVMDKPEPERWGAYRWYREQKFELVPLQ